MRLRIMMKWYKKYDPQKLEYGYNRMPDGEEIFLFRIRHWDCGSTGQNFRLFEKLLLF